MIRIERIELSNFKNIGHGVIECTNYKNKLFYLEHADLIGIYGQNGSGKTSVIEAIRLLKEMLSGKYSFGG